MERRRRRHRVPRWWREWLSPLRWLPLIRDRERLLHCLELLRAATYMLQDMLANMDAQEVERDGIPGPRVAIPHGGREPDSPDPEDPEANMEEATP